MITVMRARDEIEKENDSRGTFYHQISVCDDP